MVFSYNWLQSFFKRKLPNPQILADLLTTYFAEVEEIKKERKDFILDIDVKPIRAGDCFSHLGIARECSAILKSEIRNPKSEIKENKNLKAEKFVIVEVKDKEACPRYTARVVTDVKVGPSPIWIQTRLKACGLRPISNIVDIANYVMLETGQPLHTFDGGKLAGQKIIVRYAKEGEKITTLDEEKYDLDKNILVIADAKSPVAIAGIKGGKLPGIDEKTRVVVLESANFNPRTVRCGSKRIDLKTDASLRFEHGVDPNLTEFAINRAAYLIQEVAKGKVAKGLIDIYPKKVFPKIIKLDLDYVERLLGIKIPLTEIKNILKRLNFQLMGIRFPLMTVKVPTWRIDVLMQEDLVEEIGRIHGYQKIPTIFPLAVLIPPKRNLDILWENIAKDVLKELGLTEVYNYSFISEKDKEVFQYKDKELIEIENPTSLDFQYLRPSLIPNLLKNIEKNQKNFPEIKIFELGKIFQPPKIEKTILTGILTGEEFYTAKGMVDLLLQKLGISDVWYDEYRTRAEDAKISWWHPKKCAEIKIGNERIGFLGEISARILGESKINSKIVYFDIFFDRLSQLSSEEHEYRPISRYPSAIRDVAILVPKLIKVEEILNKIYTAGSDLIRDVDLFDIYEGEELPGGKKSLAFHIIYQAEDRTLSSKEIDEVQNKIIKALEEIPEWQVRN